MFQRQPVFISPVSYRNASREELKRECNGCGPKGYDWVVPDSIIGIDITECCNIHDWMYYVGSTPHDRLWADMIFLINMKRAINFPKHKWKTLTNCQLKLAMFYFKMVRKHGDDAFVKSPLVSI